MASGGLAEFDFFCPGPISANVNVRVFTLCTHNKYSQLSLLRLFCQFDLSPWESDLELIWAISQKLELTQLAESSNFVHITSKASIWSFCCYFVNLTFDLGTVVLDLKNFSKLDHISYVLQVGTHNKYGQYLCLLRLFCQLYTFTVGQWPRQCISSLLLKVVTSYLVHMTSMVSSCVF